jgi:hypothetical protein
MLIISLAVICLLLLPVLLLLLMAVVYVAVKGFDIWWSIHSVRQGIDFSSMSEKEIDETRENWVQRNFDLYL